MICSFDILHNLILTASEDFNFYFVNDESSSTSKCSLGELLDFVDQNFDSTYLFNYDSSCNVARCVKWFRNDLYKFEHIFVIMVKKDFKLE